MPPPRKLRFRSQFSLRPSMSTRWRRSAASETIAGGRSSGSFRRCGTGIWAKSDSTSGAPTASSSSRWSASVEFGMYGCARLIPAPRAGKAGASALPCAPVPAEPAPPRSLPALSSLRSCGHAVDERAPRRHVHPAVAAERTVELGVARVDTEERRLQRKQLAEAGDDLDVLDADAPQHRGAQLLVAPAEDRALTADDADHEGHRLVCDQIEQVALGEVAAEHPAGAHCVDSEERLLDSQL